MKYLKLFEETLENFSQLEYEEEESGEYREISLSDIKNGTEVICIKTCSQVTNKNLQYRENEIIEIEEGDFKIIAGGGYSVTHENYLCIYFTDTPAGLGAYYAKNFRIW